MASHGKEAVVGWMQCRVVCSGMSDEFDPRVQEEGMQRAIVACVVSLCVVYVGVGAVIASDAQMYFSSDKNGQNRVAEIQEGDAIWIVVADPDENIDCDVRDKIWTDIKIMDPKTGAYIVWMSYKTQAGDAEGRPYTDPAYVPFKGHSPGTVTAGWVGTSSLPGDYLEESGADTGVFVSSRSFQVGTREDFNDPTKHAHIVSRIGPIADTLQDFQWGNFIYLDGNGAPAPAFADDCRWMAPGPSVWSASALTMKTPLLPSAWTSPTGMGDYLIGRFENMDTLVGMYQDPNDGTDVAVALMKIIDTEATIAWDQEVYEDANDAASITVVDPDENLNCNEVEWVPVFVLVNPGSWNENTYQEVNSFCSLLQDGGRNVARARFTVAASPIRWYNIYEERYIYYPFTTDGTGENIVAFDTTDANGFARVTFYAQETGANTGVFQLSLNSILVDLQFDSLNVRDVLVAYYLDPNDPDDFKLATAYIEERQHSITIFSDDTRGEQEEYWLGRDPVYVQVIDGNANVDPCCPEQVVVHLCDPHGEDDAEWLILDETSSNSPVFFTVFGTPLEPVWAALGIGLGDAMGGFQLEVDNWRLEAFNEDDIYARYNDVYYGASDPAIINGNDTSGGTATLGDGDGTTSFPPWITRVRVANDVSFDVMHIGDTQVVDGDAVNMSFLDRRGNRVSGYVNSDCVFIEVIDPDQDEDRARRERIDAYWDGGQNVPFGPISGGAWDCGPIGEGQFHPVNRLLGHIDIYNSEPENSLAPGGWAKLYVLNPRSGYWTAVDLMETGIDTGVFRSVICVDLMAVHECVPTLGALPGDTIIAVYQDPSNHSDSAWISIKVGIGGGGIPVSQASSTVFADETGAEVASYMDADTVYVKVIDPSHRGAAVLPDAVEIAGETYDIGPLAGATEDTFITERLALDLVAGESITATYTDPANPLDESSDTIEIVASVLDVTGFVVSPNPFDGEVTFGYEGTGVATTFIVTIYSVAGDLVWTAEEENVTEITWNASGVAKGAFVYAISVSDGENVFEGKDVMVKE